ncbi:hypothetical protein [Reticulibacter mediterranei]|uniref:hypothetical protein n=1 Tax=Reticulibacter mediterranei TaxID=2778369 RepID=UPI001C68AF77|nr:hypothetical protein [Reticulibacter mediterranei]
MTCKYLHDASLTFHPSEQEVGVDLGVKVFAMLSTGEAIEHPRHLREEENTIAAHRTIHRRHRAKKALAIARTNILGQEVSHRSRSPCVERNPSCRSPCIPAWGASQT